MALTPARNRRPVDALVFPALLAMQAVWFLTWEPGMEQGIITGLAVGLVVARGRGAAPTLQPRPGSPPVTAGTTRKHIGAPDQARRPGS